MSTSLFKTVYLDNINKDPLVRKFQNPAFQFVKSLDDIQKNNKILFGGIQAINTLLGSLSDRDYEVKKLKTLHNTNWDLYKKLSNDYWVMAVDIVDCLDDGIGAMTDLGRLREMLQQEYQMKYNDELLVKKHIFDDPKYKKIAKKILDSQYKFKKLNNKRVEVVNNLLSQLSSLMALERDLIEATERSTSLDMYDTTSNSAFMKRITNTVKQYLTLFEDSVNKLDSYHKNLQHLQDKIHDLESEYRSKNETDPNFYMGYTPITSYEDMYHTANKVSRALKLEIDNLQREVHAMDSKALRNAQYKDQLILQNHPRIRGLASGKKTMKDLMKIHVKDTKKMVTEITECIKKKDEEIDYCVSHLKAVQDLDFKKMQSHIDYIRAQQRSAKDKLNYSRILMACYDQLNKMIRLQQKEELDKQTMQQQKEIAESIVKQLQATQELESRTKNLTVLRELYNRTLKDNQSKSSKDLKKNLEQIIAINNDTANIANILSKSQQKFARDTAESAMIRDSSAIMDAKGLRESFRKDLNVGKMLYDNGDKYVDYEYHPEDWKKFDINNPEPNWSVFGDEESQKQAKIKSGFLEPPVEKMEGGAIAVKALRNHAQNQFNGVVNELMRGGADLDSLQEMLKSVGAELERGAKKGGEELKALYGRVNEQVGGGAFSYMIANKFNLKTISKILGEEIDNARRIAYSRITEYVSMGQMSRDQADLLKIRLEIALAMKREELLGSQIKNMGANTKKLTDELIKEVENEYISNALFSNIGAYMKLYPEVRKAGRMFESQNLLFRKYFATLTRKVGPETEEYKRLIEKDREFGKWIKILMQQIDIVNNLCTYKKLELLKIIKDPYNAMSEDASTDVDIKNAYNCAKDCSDGIRKFSRLSLQLTSSTEDLLKTMDAVEEIVTFKEQMTKLEGKNLKTVQSQNLLLNTSREYLQDVLQSIQAFILQYMQMSYEIKKYVMQNRFGMDEGYMIKNLWTDIQQSGSNIVDISSGTLKNEFEKLKDLNGKIATLLSKESSYAGVSKEDKQSELGRKIIQLNIHLQERAQVMDMIAGGLSNIEGELAKEREALSELSEIDIRHNVSMMMMFNQLTMAMWMTSHGIKQKLTKVGAFISAMMKTQDTLPAPRSFDISLTWIKNTHETVLKLWSEVQNQLKSSNAGPQAVSYEAMTKLQDATTLGNDKLNKANNIILGYINNLITRVNVDMKQASKLTSDVLAEDIDTSIAQQLATIEGSTVGSDQSLSDQVLALAGQILAERIGNTRLNEKGQPLSAGDIQAIKDKLATLEQSIQMDVADADAKGEYTKLAQTLLTDVVSSMIIAMTIILSQMIYSKKIDIARDQFNKMYCSGFETRALNECGESLKENQAQLRKFSADVMSKLNALKRNLPRNSKTFGSQLDFVKKQAEEVCNAMKESDLYKGLSGNELGKSVNELCEMFTIVGDFKNASTIDVNLLNNASNQLANAVYNLTKDSLIDNLQLIYNSIKLSHGCDVKDELNQLTSIKNNLDRDFEKAKTILEKMSVVNGYLGDYRAGRASGNTVRGAVASLSGLFNQCRRKLLEDNKTRSQQLSAQRAKAPAEPEVEKKITGLFSSPAPTPSAPPLVKEKEE